MRRIASVLSGLFVLFALWLAPATAGEITVREARLHPVDEGIALDAEFALSVKPKLVEAVNNGVPMYFVVEFELTRARWYWLDERAVSRRMQVRLSYHALTRQYRLSTGLLQQSFATLEEAVEVLQRVRGWLVVDQSVTLSDAIYEASVRMSLDTTLLPKPFQVDALTSRDWQFDSPWKRFPYRPPVPVVPVESRDAVRPSTR